MPALALLLHNGSTGVVTMTIRGAVFTMGVAALVGMSAMPASAQPWGRYGPPPGRVVPRHPGYPVYQQHVQVGYDFGFRDGYEKGRSDARGRNARFDPNRHKWFKNASRGYENYFGPKQAYQQVYRSGFSAGYERAFQEAFGYRNGYGYGNGYGPRPRSGGSVEFRFGW